jgi:hypothetical protein
LSLGSFGQALWPEQLESAAALLTAHYKIGFAESEGVSVLMPVLDSLLAAVAAAAAAEMLALIVVVEVSRELQKLAPLAVLRT